MINPFAYREASNPLSGLAAGPKTLFLLCSAGASMTFGPPALALLLASGLVLHSLARIRPGETARALVFILGLAAAAALFRGLAPGDGRIFALESLGPSALYALRLVAVFLFARVFYVSTRVSRLGDSLTRVFRRAMPPSGSRGQSVFSDPGLFVTLTLLFLPRVFDDLIRVREATALRCYGGGGTKLKRELVMLSTIIFVALKGGLRTAGALEARGYSNSRTIDVPKWKLIDWLAAASGPVLLVLGAVAGSAGKG